MNDEFELIMEKLAYIRENLLDESDFISDDGYDLLSSCVGSAYEVLCVMESKIIRQKEEIELLGDRNEDVLYDITFEPVPKRTFKL